jgi:hypothetical protein
VTRRLLAPWLAVFGVLAAGLPLCGPAAATKPPPARAHRAAAKEARWHTFLGPDGVVSTAVIAENRRPGTTAWQLTDQPATGFIEGFANQNYTAGGPVTLYVSTSAPSFSVTAYRMGYYGGKGGRRVWQSASIPGVAQPPCPLTPGVNMVSCDNWSPSVTMDVTRAFVPGDYLLKLVGTGGLQSYVLLTVWDPQSRAAYLVMGRTLTEEGWNTFGGYSYYQGQGPCAPGSDTYPVCNRARVVSFDRPMSTGDGASDFLSNEYPLVRWAEQHGLDVTYATDVTVDEHPTMVLQHRALLSLGHDETWTNGDRLAALAAQADGVNIVFFGAAAVLRHSRLQASPFGPDREEVDYRDSTEDPLAQGGDPMAVTGNTWSSPPSSWSEIPLTGQIYSGYLEPGAAPVPLIVWNGSSWLFRGTGLGDGSSVPGVIDSDIDHVDPGVGPSNLEVLAHSPVPLHVAYTNQGTWGGNTYADTTYYTDPTSKAGVFDAGTVNWIFAMSPCAAGTHCPGTAIDKMTGNLLWLFGQGPAGLHQPSTPNWQAVNPPGS